MEFIQGYEDKHPHWAWMKEQEEKNTPPGAKYWLWDNEKAVNKIIAGMKEDGSLYGESFADAEFMARRFKFVKEPYLSLFREYLEDDIRHYDREVMFYSEYDIRTLFNIMVDYRVSYPEAIFISAIKRDPMEHPSDGKLWGIKHRTVGPLPLSERQQELRHMLPTEDGFSLRPMTDAEISAFEEKEAQKNIITEEDIKQHERLMKMIESGEAERRLQAYLKSKAEGSNVQK